MINTEQPAISVAPAESTHVANARTDKERSQSKRSGEKPKSARKQAAARTKRLSAPIMTSSKPASKQDRVIAMLQRKDGTSIAAIMKTTGWQKHSVRGFFAGLVRKKLRLNLTSAEVDGKRIYRITPGKPAARQRCR
jgi:hypothetical protein